MTPEKRIRAVVVGAGIGGLAAAYRLHKTAQDRGIHLGLSILEASSRAGGVLLSETRDGFVMEWGPDCFISEKPAATKLAQELGLESEIVGTNPDCRQSFICLGGKLIPVPKDFYLIAPRSILPFITSSVMTWRGKIRCFMDVFIPRRREAGDETLASFVRRRLGREALERIAQPLVAGIYTADPENLSLTATMPRFLKWEREYGSVIRGLRKQIRKSHAASGPRYGLFVTLKGGLEQLSRRLVQELPAGSLKLDAPVRRVTRHGTAWTVETERGAPLTADRVFLALPGHASARLLRESVPNVAETLNTIPYASSAIMNLAFRLDQVGHPMDGMGLVIPSGENRSMIAASFSHRKFGHRTPPGFALIRAFLGGAMHEEILKRDDDELRRLVMADLREILKIQGEPIFADVRRWEKSMPQYTLNHLDRVEKIERDLDAAPGLHLIGNAFRGIGVPDCIASADRAVEKALAYATVTSLQR